MGEWSIPKGSDEWANGHTFDEMRAACPDPRLTAAERKNPVELAAIEAGMVPFDAWEIYDGSYLDPHYNSYIRVSIEPDAFTIVGDCEPEDIDLLRRWATAFLRLTSPSPTGASNSTTVVEVLA